MGAHLSGAYLSDPETEKFSTDESGTRVICGASSMQGWRESQEDAHNCCIDFDEDTSLFAVYDGHGGHEVAAYCAENFPKFLKNCEKYKNGEFKEALEEAFLGFDAQLKEPDVIEVLKQIVSRDKSESDSDGMEEENVDSLKEESNMPLDEVISKYQNELNMLKKESEDEAGSSSLSYSKGKNCKNSGPSTSKASDDAGSLGGGGDAEGSSEKQNKEEENKKKESDQGKGDSELVNKENTAEVEEKSEKNNKLKSDKEKEIINEQESNGENKKVKMDEEKDSSDLNEGQNKKEEDNKDEKTIESDKNNIKDEKESIKVNSPKKTKTASQEEENEENKKEKEDENKDQEKKAEFKKALDKTKNCEVNGESSDNEEGSKKTALENGEVKKKKRMIEPLRARALYHQLIYGSSEDDSNLDDDDSDESFEGNGSDSPENIEIAEDDDEEEDEDDDDDDEEEDDDFIDDEDAGFSSLVHGPGADSGCTAVVALLRKNTLFVANAGDSRCVVCRKGRAIEMSFDHKPEDKLEQARIEKAGGRVSLEGRVNGGLNLSRALGDHCYKQNKELPPEEQMITAKPDVKLLTINPEEDDFMVLACDGIWNFMSSQEVVDFVKLRLNDNREKPSKICEELFDHCLAPNTFGDGTGCDNMTALIVIFKYNGVKSNKRALLTTEETTTECKVPKKSEEPEESPSIKE